MTERLSDITARIDGIRQLGAVVNAMRGIAGARAQAARSQLHAVDSYARSVAQAIGHVLALMPAADEGRHDRARGSALVLFGAEQGFVGAFSERLLDAIAADLTKSEIFVIGTRSAAIAAERNIATAWTARMPSHSAGIPRLADTIAEALYARIATGEIDRLEAVFARWHGGGLAIERRRLFPLDTAAHPRPIEENPPLSNIAPAALLRELTADYVHAQLCDAALHAFAAENEARMELMAAARREIERQVENLRKVQRRVRQEEITAEIIELATGEAANRLARRDDRTALTPKDERHRPPE